MMRKTESVKTHYIFDESTTDRRISAGWVLSNEHVTLHVGNATIHMTTFSEVDKAIKALNGILDDAGY